MSRPHKKLAYSDEQIRVWVEDEGRTHAWVAEKLGYSAGHMTEVLKRMGIQSRPRGPRPAEGHGRWKGGRTLVRGYWLRRVYGHPHSRFRSKHNGGGYVLEHRLVMEEHLGRYLRHGEVVHHKNGDKQDNRLENLQLFACNADHLRHELTGRVPRWTEEGLRRMQEARRQPRVHPLDTSDHQLASRDDPPSPRTTDQMPSSRDEGDARPS